MTCQILARHEMRDIELIRAVVRMHLAACAVA